jgi:hypothetical protein
VVSPLLSNILLTPFDKEMRHKGYQLTRWADDWVVTCRTRAAANSALAQATKILGKLGVTLNREKTRIVHIAQGFEFLGFKIGRGKGRFKLSRDRITSKLNRQNLYAIPSQKSLDRFKDQIRALTRRRTPLRMGELIETINRLSAAGATTTAAPKLEGASTNWMDGSSEGCGRIAPSDGGTPAGRNIPPNGFWESSSWSTLSH